MTLTLNIPDAVAPQVIDGLCVAGNYNPVSGITKAVFAKGQLLRFLENAAVAGHARKANSDFRAVLAANQIS